MKIKTATLLALIGSILNLFYPIYFVLELDRHFKYGFIFVMVMVLISSLSYVIFFYSLYKNQK